MIEFSLQIIVRAVLNMSLSHEAYTFSFNHRTLTNIQLTKNELSSPPKKYVCKYISYKIKTKHAF
jgi:hypothetical protein